MPGDDAVILGLRAVSGGPDPPVILGRRRSYAPIGASSAGRRVRVGKLALAADLLKVYLVIISIWSPANGDANDFLPRGVDPHDLDGELAVNMRAIPRTRELENNTVGLS
jgi:hypothetical protein